MGYHPWGHKEWDTTEQLSTADTYFPNDYIYFLIDSDINVLENSAISAPEEIALKSGSYKV